MSEETARIVAAEADAAKARAQLSTTLALIQRRVEPRRLADEAKRSLADAGSAAAERTKDAVRRRPAVLAGVVAVAGLFFIRHRLAAMVRRKPKATVYEHTS
jgi:ElaB/YqjD/DUF883 family membrane-anchored ribosome-binding protein